MRWFFNRPYENGCGYYRQLLPLRHLMPQLRAMGVQATFSARLDLDRVYDAYVFSRNLDPQFIPLIMGLKRKGRVIVWDLDDDVLDYGRYGPSEKQTAICEIPALQLYLELADVITVSTEFLVGIVDHPGKTFVAPNLVDLVDVPPILGGPERRAILYAGGDSHGRDIELIRGLHDRTYRRFPWVFYGIKPAWLKSHDTWIPWGRVSDYFRVCQLVRPLASLCPLEPCRFDESKSPIKVWETATLGGAVLASDTGPYRGHPASIVAEGEPFTTDHLEAVTSPSNNPACLDVALANSWQQTASGHRAWMKAFRRIVLLCAHKGSLKLAS
jgi:hypothetical protein